MERLYKTLSSSATTQNDVVYKFKLREEHSRPNVGYDWHRSRWLLMIEFLKHY